MDERRDTDKNIKYRCIVRRSDGTEEELPENLTVEDLMRLLKEYEGKKQETVEKESAKEELNSESGEKTDCNFEIDDRLEEESHDDEYVGSKENTEEIDEYNNEEETVCSYMTPLNDDSDSSEEDFDAEDDMEEETDEDYDEEPEEKLFSSLVDNHSDYDDEERCPMCGSTDIDELERGTLVGSITGGVLGFNRRGVVKSFLPDLASRGVGGVIGYAVGYAAGKVLDKKLLNNRKCAHCGYEWHEDEDIF